MDETARIVEIEKLNGKKRYRIEMWQDGRFQPCEDIWGGPWETDSLRKARKALKNYQGDLDIAERIVWSGN